MPTSKLHTYNSRIQVWNILNLRCPKHMAGNESVNLSFVWNHVNIIYVLQHRLENGQINYWVMPQLKFIPNLIKKAKHQEVILT